MCKYVTFKCLLAGLKNSFLFCGAKEIKKLLVTNRNQSNEKGTVYFIQSSNCYSYGTDKRTFRGT